jgi:Protein of unknown function (DUF4230)
VFGSPLSQQEFYVLAEQRLAEAARSSGLLERAADNARSMLTRLFASLGFRVTFSPA